MDFTCNQGREEAMAVLKNGPTNTEADKGLLRIVIDWAGYAGPSDSGADGLRHPTGTRPVGGGATARQFVGQGRFAQRRGAFCAFATGMGVWSLWLQQPASRTDR